MRIKFKSLILFLLMNSATIPTFAQFGGGLSFIKPSGDLAYLFKSTAAIELYYRLSDADARFSYSASIGFYHFKMRQDTMPIYGLKDDGGQLTLLGGWQNVSRYYVIPIGIHAEYRFLDADFSPFAGADFYLNISTYDNHYFIEDLIDYEETGGSKGIALMPKIGVYKKLNDDFDLSFSLGKAFGIDIDQGEVQKYWKIYFCLIYNGL